METDRRWADALSGQLARYPHILARPLDNTYGMLFATRLPMRDGRIETIAEKDTPSISAAHEKLPVLAIGDFNDVAWSHTSQLFKRIGGYLDPRIGRGAFATFPAQVPWLAWPLDHLFVPPEFDVRSLAVLEDVGSDHLPVSAKLCLTGRTSRNEAPEPVSAEDRRDVSEVRPLSNTGTTRTVRPAMVAHAGTTAENPVYGTEVERADAIGNSASIGSTSGNM